MASSSRTPLHVASRVGASLIGGYAFTWGFTTLGIALLLAGGMPFGDARALAYLLAFLVFLAAFCWAFVASSLWRVWTLLAGGGAVLSAATWLLLRAPV